MTVEHVESIMQFAGRCAPWKFTTGAENNVSQVVAPAPIPGRHKSLLTY